LRLSRGRSGLVIEKEELDIQIRPAGVPAEFSSGGNLKEGSVKTESAVGVSKETPIAAGIPKGVTQDVVLVVPPVGMPAEVPLSPKSIKPNPEDEYNEALRILNEEHSYPRARLIFNRFVSKNTTHELADDAQYWIGESYFQEKNFERAILAFNKVQVDYANGDKAPDALLKEALAFLNLGDKASARELLARVIQKYPNSSVAITATERLKSL
jgi:tol-pal system protein YbgF